jgi:lactoylglutathione lyase
MRPTHDKTSMLITFLYYVDLGKAVAFYEGVLGLPLVIDQGWSKIYAVTGGGHIGLVDETHGMHKAHPVKPVQLCLRVDDVDAWSSYLTTQGVAIESGPRDIPSLGIRIIIFYDPEGYQVEMQSVVA